MSLRPISFCLGLFLDEQDVDRSREALLLLMEALAHINYSWFVNYSGTPGLYSTRIVYKPEVDTEEWQDVPTTIKRGYGDCEDLACYRIGELRSQGIVAMPYIQWRETGKRKSSVMFHALVRWPDGRIEDPSRARGMRGLPVINQPYFLEAPNV